MTFGGGLFFGARHLPGAIPENYSLHLPPCGSFKPYRAVTRFRAGILRKKKAAHKCAAKFREETSKKNRRENSSYAQLYSRAVGYDDRAYFAAQQCCKCGGNVIFYTAFCGD
jgi:hypothetical protein